MAQFEALPSVWRGFGSCFKLRPWFGRLRSWVMPTGGAARPMAGYVPPTGGLWGSHPAKSSKVRHVDMVSQYHQITVWA